MYPRLRQWLDGPNAERIIFASIVALALLSIDTGLVADDHIHALILSGSTEIPGLWRSPLDLFSFATGDPEINARTMRDGVFPWWADPNVKLSFWRPITAATHWIDHRFWPNAAWLMHAHSIAWFLVGVTGVRALYRDLLSPTWLAVLALALYGLDDARGAPIAWIANRNSLVAGAFAIWAVVLHARSRDENAHAGTWLAPPLFALGLLAGEAAIGMAAYLFAYALCLDENGPWPLRLARLLPFALVIASWKLAYGALGYGVFGSGIYTDPLGEPFAFVLHLAERPLPLVLSQLALPWSEWWLGYPFVFPPLTWIVGATAVVAIGATGFLVAPLWRADRVTRFFVLGALLAVVPLCATFPSDRMLLFVAIGAFGMTAQLFARGIERASTGARAWRLLPHAIVGVHLVLAPLLYPLRARGGEALRRSLDLAIESVPQDADLPKQHLILVNPPADPFAAYIPIRRAALGIPHARAQSWLSTGATEVTIERLDDRTLRVAPDGGFMTVYSEWMLRSRAHPMRPGDVIELDPCTITVSKMTADARPAEAVVRFRIPMDDPSLRWLRWRDLGYEPFEVPNVGETTVLEAVDMLRVGLAY